MRFFIYSQFSCVNFVDGLRGGVVDFGRSRGVGDGHAHVVDKIDQL